MSNQAIRKKWFERNEQAEALEAEGREREALALYEANAAEDCDIGFTYERLAAIYRRQQRFEDELRALEKAYFIERRRGPSSNLVRLQRRIDTTIQVRDRERTRSREVGSHSVSEPVILEKKAAPKKGCLAVLALYAALAGLLAAFA